MNEEQKAEWKSIVDSCISSDLRSINVGSKIRRDAILAANDDLLYWRTTYDDLAHKVRELFDVNSYPWIDDA